MQPESFISDYTTQEYFLNKRESLFPDAQVDMALTCLQYLSFNAFKQKHDAWLQPSLLYKYPFVLYAAFHWGHHALTNEEATFNMVQTFLSCKPNVAYATALLLDVQHGYRLHQTDFGEIHLLSFFGLGRTISQLLKINHSTDSKDGMGRTPLSHAATRGHSEVVQLLLT